MDKNSDKSQIIKNSKDVIENNKSPKELYKIIKKICWV
jgi:hypothetical protein